MAEQFPKQFGKYVLLKSLARGGMGEIYLAASGQPGGLNKLCVIKKVITEKADPAKVNRFLDEAKVVLRLSHANLVSTFDAGDVDGELFIAMELVEGKDLREIWNRCVRTRTRIPVDVALVVVREIARALAYVHTYGGLRLVHRDVAPPNLLLSYFGEVKLTDFGLARSILKQEHTAPGVVFGRASYLAPEQARGEVADGRTDVYSLGIVLWELLTGQPYLQLAGLDPVTSLSLVRNPKTQPPSTRAPWIAPELDAIVLKSLAADRTMRFQSAEEMRRALADVMTRVAPRADAERVAEFLRGLYRDTLVEESAERERLLAETLPLFRGETLPDDSHTPLTNVIPPVALGRVATESTSDNEATVVAPSPLGATVSAVAEAPKESLHVSALRARAGSQVQARRAPAESSGVDAPTKVWRKGKGKPGDDAVGAQTFVGRVIDSRYRIRERIGEGGMGTVYAAEHVEIGKKVAVKILHRLFSGETNLVERFRREARAASRVGHPHIIDVTDFGTTEEGCTYFVMEYLEGLDLADVLVNEGQVDPLRAVRISVQICQALEAAHTAGIIHRDLKPENIFLVARDGQADFAKVLDFGIARNLFGESSRLTNPGMAMGTPEYMAPEQSAGRPADRRTDVYAVGALLYEMVMGVAPFKSESQQAMYEAKKRPPPSLRERRPDVPLALDAVIVRALAPDPDERPQTMAQLEYELAKIVSGRPRAVADLLGLREGNGRPVKTGEAENLPPTGSGNGHADGDREGGFSSRDSGVSQADDVARTPQPRPSIAQPADIEKLLEADLSPLPVAKRIEPSVAATAPAQRRMSTSVHGGNAVGRASAMVNASGRMGVSMAAGAAPWSAVPAANGAAPRSVVPAIAPVPRGPAPAGAATAPGAGIDVDVDATAVAIRQAPGRASLVVGLSLALIGAGVGAWMWRGKYRAPESAREWVRRFGRSPVAVLKQTPSASLSRANGTVVPVRASSPIRSSPIAVVQATSHPGASITPAERATIPTRMVPEIVQTPAVDRARAALSAGQPDDAIAVLRPAVSAGNAAAKPLLAEALVASGWKDVKVYRWNAANHKAREALTMTAPGGPSHGAHALLGEALYAVRDFNGALGEFNRALGESPRDARLRRRVIRSRRQLRGADSAAPEATSEE